MDALDSVLKIEERLVAKATLANIPIGGTFELLPLCNMNCEMCFIRLSKNEMDSIGRLRTADEWLDIAKQMKNAGTLFVLITGGEPLLFPEFKKLYRGLRKLGMIVTINTNGTLITEDIAKMFGEDKPRRINITLYGASNETYNKLCHNPNGFDQTIRGIELLMKYHIDIKLNGTIVPENQYEIKLLQDIANKYNLYMKMDTYIYPTSRERIQLFNDNARLPAKLAAQKNIEIKKLQKTADAFSEYKQFMLDNCYSSETKEDSSLSCRAGKSAFWITWYGDMTPCIFMKKPSINVFEEGFNKSWNYIIDEAKKLHMPTKCLSCEKRKICQVCGASAFCENGSFEKEPKYMCEYIDEILKELRSAK